MRSVHLRELVRARRDQAARERVAAPHVEFCTECGKATDRTGRRDASRCFECARKHLKEKPS